MHTHSMECVLAQRNLACHTAPHTHSAAPHLVDDAWDHGQAPSIVHACYMLLCVRVVQQPQRGVHIHGLQRAANNAAECRREQDR